METQERYVVRSYVRGDKDALRPLMKEVWADTPIEAFDNRWWWLWDEPPLYVVEDTETKSIVGICAYIPFLLNFEQQVYESAWFVDFFVSLQHQRKGLGKCLTTAVTNRFPITASLSQTDAAWAVFRRLGWQERQYAKMYVNLFPLLPGAMKVIGISSKKNLSQRIETGPVLNDGSFNEEFDELWQHLRNSFGAIAVRDAAALQRRYCEQPDRQYTMLRGYRGDELAGYIILRTCPPNSLRSLRKYPMPKYPIGLIVDYLVDPQDMPLFAAMLDKATTCLLKHGARYLLCLSTVPAFHSILVRRGFLHSGTPLVGSKLSVLRVGFTFTTQLNVEALNNSPWFLTLSDCDTDLLWGSY